MSWTRFAFSKEKIQDEEQLHLIIVQVFWYNLSSDFHVLKMVSAIVLANSHRNGTSILKVIIERESSNPQKFSNSEKNI